MKLVWPFTVWARKRTLSYRHDRQKGQSPANGQKNQARIQSQRLSDSNHKGRWGAWGQKEQKLVPSKHTNTHTL